MGVSLNLVASWSNPILLHSINKITNKRVPIDQEEFILTILF